MRFDVTLADVSMGKIHLTARPAWLVDLGCAHSKRTQDSKFRFELAARICFGDLCLAFLDGLPSNGLTNLRAPIPRLGNRRKQARILVGSRGRWRTSSSAAAFTIASVTLLAFDATIPSASPGNMYELLVCAMSISFPPTRTGSKRASSSDQRASFRPVHQILRRRFAARGRIRKRGKMIGRSEY